MKTRTRSIALLMVLAMVFALAACGSKTDSSTTPTGSGSNNNADEPRVLRVGSMSTNSGFNPVGSSMEMVSSLLVYEAVVRRVSGSEVEDWCGSYKWDDATSLTITLRDDVYFSDGEQMLAEDVLYSYQRLAGNQMTATFSILQNVDWDACKLSDDNLSVTIKLKAESSVFEPYLADFYIVNKSVAENWADDNANWWDKPVASGPYEVVENVAGSHSTYKLREDYWNKNVQVDWDEIIYYTYSDATAMFIAFENNEIDLVLGIASDDLKRIQAGNVNNVDNIVYEQISTNAAWYLTFSPYIEELSDIKVREAIANAIDRDAVGEVAFGGQYTKIDSVLPSNYPYYKKTGTYEKGLEYAKQCMAESKYPNGFKLNVIAGNETTLVWDVIKENLSNIGIDITVDFYDIATMISLTQAEGGTSMGFMTQQGGNYQCSPYVALANSPSTGPAPNSRVMDEEYNKYFQLAVSTTDTTKLAEYYGEMQQILYDEIQWVPIVVDITTFAYHKDVISSCSFYSTLFADILQCRAA